MAEPFPRDSVIVNKRTGRRWIVSSYHYASVHPYAGKIILYRHGIGVNQKGKRQYKELPIEGAKFYELWNGVSND